MMAEVTSTKPITPTTFAIKPSSINSKKKIPAKATPRIALMIPSVLFRFLCTCFILDGEKNLDKQKLLIKLPPPVILSGLSKFNYKNRRYGLNNNSKCDGIPSSCYQTATYSDDKKQAGLKIKPT